jgi:RNA-directed DNA polymerase
VDKYGRVYVNLSPAVSREAMKAMCQTVRGWHLQLKCDKDLSDLAKMFGPVLRGWSNYYGRFYASAMRPLWRSVNAYLVRWMQRKYKRLARGVPRASRALGRLAERAPHSFVHWEQGIIPAAR